MSNIASARVFSHYLKMIIALAVLVAGLQGCKTRHKAIPPVVKDEKKPEDKTAPDLQQLIAGHSFRARTLSAKANVKTNIGGEQNSFNINLRLYTDSTIWISISPLLGIEVARIFITRDTVKFIDRINNRYSVSGYQFLNDLLNVSIDFDIIQGVLTGNLFAYKKNKFNSVYIEDKYYILSTLSKRKLKRSLEEIDIDKPIVQDLWVSDSTYRVVRLNIEDNRVGKSLVTDYQDHRQTEGGLFPFISNTRIKAGKDAQIEIEYSKVTLNNEIDFPFTIPSGFSPIR
jgi:hypothetical protein